MNIILDKVQELLNQQNIAVVQNVEDDSYVFIYDTDGQDIYTIGVDWSSFYYCLEVGELEDEYKIISGSDEINKAITELLKIVTVSQECIDWGIGDIWCDECLVEDYDTITQEEIIELTMEYQECDNLEDAKERYAKGFAECLQLFSDIKNLLGGL